MKRKLCLDKYFFSALPLAVALFFRGLIYLFVDDKVLSVAANKVLTLSWLPDQVSQVVWVLTGLLLFLEACGLVKPLLLQVAIRGLATLVALDLVVYANYLTFFVPGTQLLVGALVAHWGIALNYFLGLKLGAREFTTVDYQTKRFIEGL